MARVQAHAVLLITWCVVCSLAGPSPAALATETPNEAYFAAVALGTTGDPSAAAEALRALQATRPDLLRVRRALAVIDDYESGRAGSEVASLVLEGQRLIEKEEWSQAEEILSGAVERGPEYYAAWHDLGRARFERGRVRGAREAYETALRLRPDYPYSLNNLGLTYWRLGDYKHALERLRRAVKVDPGYCNAYNTLGWVLRTLGREDEARKTFTKAQALCPDDPWPEANLAFELPGTAAPRPSDRQDEEAGGEAAGAPTTRELVKRLTSRQAESRAAAADRLIERRDPAAVPALIALLDHKRDAVRATAIRILGAYRDAQLLAPLTEAARTDRAWVVRIDAILALALLSDESTTPTLITISKDDQAYQARHAAVVALCSRSSCAAAHSLRRALQDRAVEVRNAARFCLKRLGGSEPPGEAALLDDWISGWCSDAPGVTE